MASILIEEAKTIADSNRLIPPFSVTATDPADVYPLHDIISDVEWKALDISVFEGVELADAEKALPFRHSSWINQHVKVLIGDTGKGRKKNLCVGHMSSFFYRFLMPCGQKNHSIYLYDARVP